MKSKIMIAAILVMVLSSTLLLNAKTIGTLPIPFDTNISLAIYSAGGQIIKTIFECEPVKQGQRLNIEWDGKDDAGRDMPAGKYGWKAILTNAKAYDDGWIGDTAEIPYGYLNEHGTSVHGVFIDTNGDVYETSGWEEAHQELRVWDKNGVGLRQRGAGGGADIKVDEKYVYQLAAQDWVNFAVYRYTKDTFKLRNWMGSFTGEIRLEGGVTAIAVHGDNLWISSPTEVQIRNKETAATVGKFAVNDARGLVVDPKTGNCWVSNSGDRVTEYTIDGKKLREITGLTKPRALDIGGPTNDLYIANLGDHPVLQYSIANGEPKLVRSLFRAGKPGRVYDDALLWQISDDRTSLSVDAAGNIAVADPPNQRMMIFDKDLKRTTYRFSEMVTAPMINPEANPAFVMSNNLEYMVNYQPGPNYGKWVVYNNWYGTSGNVRVKIGDRQYIYSVARQQDLLIHDVTDGTMRPCGSIIFPARPTYHDKNEDNILTPDEIMNAELKTDKVIKLSDNIWIDESGRMWTLNHVGMLVWNDANSDGIRQIGEITSYAKDAGAMGGHGVWIDNKGNWWAPNWAGETVKVDMGGLDKNNNPTYNFDNRKVVIEKENNDWGFNPVFLRVDPANGDIYRIGSSRLFPRTKGYGFWMGGTVVSRHKADGTPVSYFPNLDGFDAVVMSTDTDGNFFYKGYSDSDQLWIRAYTNDGLLVAIGRMGGPSGDSGGWMDHTLALGAFTHPVTKVHYAYAEEVFWGKSIRFRIDGMNEINDPQQKRRANSTFDWVP